MQTDTGVEEAAPLVRSARAPRRARPAAAAVTAIGCLVLAASRRSGGGAPRRRSAGAERWWRLAVVDADDDSPERVARLLIDEDVQTSVTCSDMEFAYCGTATCDVLSDDTAACGCVIYSGHDVFFSLDYTTGYLIGSAAYRKAVVRAHEGDDDAAAAAICGAMRDGSLYSATFGTSLGSASINAEATLGNASRALARASSDKASCMGAPCSAADPWDDGRCNATCICVIDTTETDTCVRNGVRESYWTNYSGLEAIVADMQADFNTETGELVDSVNRTERCRSYCTVHEKS